MANRNRRPKKSRNGPPFVLFLHEIIDSECFKLLSNSARVVYLLLLRQKGKDADKPSVKFPYKDAREYLNGATFSRAINELVKFGFINLESAVRIGSDIRQPNVYLFSQEWRTKPVDMAISIRHPKSRSTKNPKTGLFNPNNRSVEK